MNDYRIVFIPFEAAIGCGHVVESTVDGKPAKFTSVELARREARAWVAMNFLWSGSLGTYRVILFPAD